MMVHSSTFISLILIKFCRKPPLHVDLNISMASFIRKTLKSYTRFNLKFCYNIMAGNGTVYEKELSNEFNPR